jgi:hypothetical protein
MAGVVVERTLPAKAVDVAIGRIARLQRSRREQPKSTGHRTSVVARMPRSVLSRLRPCARRFSIAAASAGAYSIDRIVLNHCGRLGDSFPFAALDSKFDVCAHPHGCSCGPCLEGTTPAFTLFGYDPAFCVLEELWTPTQGKRATRSTTEPTGNCKCGFRACGI